MLQLLSPAQLSVYQMESFSHFASEVCFLHFSPSRQLKKCTMGHFPNVPTTTFVLCPWALKPFFMMHTYTQKSSVWSKNPESKHEIGRIQITHPYVQRLHLYLNACGAPRRHDNGVMMLEITVVKTVCLLWERKC